MDTDAATATAVGDAPTKKWIIGPPPAAAPPQTKKWIIGPPAASGASAAGNGRQEKPAEPGLGNFLGDFWANLVQGTQGKAATPVGRLGMGLADPIVGMGQMAARASADPPPIAFTDEQARAVGPQPDVTAGVDKAVQQREQTYEQTREAGRPVASKLGTDWYRMLGNALSPPNIALGAAGAVAAPEALAGRLAIGAAGGAAGAATEPVTKGDFWDEKLKQVGRGAAAGAGLGAAGEGLGAALAPRVSPDAERMAQQGVQMTRGQLAPGPAETVKRFEDRLQGFQVLGDFIRNARQRSIGTFNIATINQALEPIGASLPKTVKPGNEAVKTAGNAISKVYDDVLGRVPAVSQDPAFTSEVAQISQGAGMSNPDVKRKFDPLLQHEVLDYLSGGPVDGKVIKQIESELVRQMRGYLGADDFEKRELGRKLGELRGAVMGLVERQYPDAAAELRNANASWAMLTRVEQAARSAKANGVFTPSQLLDASRSQSSGVRRREFARGDALFQDWAQTAQRVLPSTVPDSGTAGRMIFEHPIQGAALGLVTSPAIPAYTQPGGAALQAYLRRIGPFRDTLQDITQGAAPGAGAATGR